MLPDRLYAYLGDLRQAMVGQASGVRQLAAAARDGIHILRFIWLVIFGIFCGGSLAYVASYWFIYVSANPTGLNIGYTLGVLPGLLIQLYPTLLAIYGVY